MTSPAGLSTTLAVQWWLPDVIEDEEKIAPTFELCCDAASTCDCPVVVTGSFPPDAAEAVVATALGDGDAEAEAEAELDADVSGDADAPAFEDALADGGAEALDVAVAARAMAEEWLAPRGVEAQAVATPAVVPVTMRPAATSVATFRPAVSIGIRFLLFLPFPIPRLPRRAETSVGATWELDEKLGSRTATGTDLRGPDHRNKGCGMSGAVITTAAGLAGASGWTQAGVALAGVGAGLINTVVGSGTLITFPVLLAAGLPPVTANVSNTLGLVPGSVSGVLGYRRELGGLAPLLRRLVAAGLAGGLTGAVLLLALPAKAFEAAVPVLIAAALVLVLVQPLLAKRLAARAQTRPRPEYGGRALLVGVYLCGIYGGYFGAAQGVLLLGLMGVLLDLPLQRINAVKNVLALAVNGIAALFFLIDGPIDWRAALLIAAGSVVGGQLGALVGRRLPAPVLRGVIVAVGVVAITRVVLG
jgi:uncharacterized membrane protein YfcA